ncbi:MAG TPA: ribosome-associated translation inhibitor RaiA [Natronosporangium sp.]
MRIEVKGRNVEVTDDLRERVERKFEKVARQVSPLAELEVELAEERNPAIRESQLAEATLHLKGVTLRAKERAIDMVHAINLVADELARQVKRHREQRRGRREAERERERERRAAARAAAAGELLGEAGAEGQPA